ncbi:hypothetical protein GQ53DRAFT_648258 [Thozetella sp. PMI_491]|nr:hypothetical protein GQ53DRAFT_648258 [Thozetella sp. PMI_491]
MLHFSEVLGPSWQVVLFTMEEMWTMPSSVQFQNAVQTDRIRIQFLPPDAIVTQWIWVNYFLTRPWIWQQVESASRVLLFQMDSIICSNSNMTVDDFLEWDYIGAPIPSAWGEGYNGGLSLRNPKMILDILASPSNDFDTKWDPGHFKSYTEDQWYYAKMKELPHAKLPDRDVAKRFSVEQEWYDQPVGYHAPRLYNRKRMQEIWEYCPEVELVNRDNKRLPGDNDDPKQK